MGTKVLMIEWSKYETSCFKTMVELNLGAQFKYFSHKGKMGYKIISPRNQHGMFGLWVELVGSIQTWEPNQSKAGSRSSKPRMHHHKPVGPIPASSRVEPARLHTL